MSIVSQPVEYTADPVTCYEGYLHGIEGLITNKDVIMFKPNNTGNKFKRLRDFSFTEALLTIDIPRADTFGTFDLFRKTIP